MDLRADTPLSELAQVHPNALNGDHYGMAPHALNLARLIHRFDKSGGQIMAIDGAWGSGKTSLLRLAKAILDPAEWAAVEKNYGLGWTDFAEVLDPFSQGTASMTDRARELREMASAQITFVEPEIWTSGTSQAIIFTLIDAIDDAINPDRGYLKQKGAEATRAVTRSPNSLIQLAGSAFALVGFPLPGDLPDGELIPGAGPATARRALKKQFEEKIGTGKIVLVIDDVDRLLPTQVADLMAAIWWVRDLKGVIILLLADRKRVAHGVAQQLFGGGSPQALDEANRYLEKIVQYTYRTPTPSAEKMFARFQSNMRNEGLEWQGNEPFVETTRSQMAKTILINWLTTPRAVIQLERAVTFGLSTLPSDSVNVVDFAVLKGLELFEPSNLEAVHARCKEIRSAIEVGSDPLKIVDMKDPGALLVAFLLPLHHSASAEPFEPLEPKGEVQIRKGFGDLGRQALYMTNAITSEVALEDLVDAFFEALFEDDGWDKNFHRAVPAEMLGEFERKVSKKIANDPEDDEVRLRKLHVGLRSYLAAQRALNQ